MSETSCENNSAISSTGKGIARHSSSLSLDRAAFLLIRIKRVFQKKKHKSAVTDKSVPAIKKTKPPLLRARTLPAIITPSLNIIQAQLVVTNQEFDENKSLKEYSKSPGLSPRHSVSSTSSTGSKDGSNKKSVSFSKITRLLTTQPKEKSTNLKPLGNALQYDSSCFFWNNKALSTERLRKSGSIDSLIDAQQANKNEINASQDCASVSANNTINKSDTFRYKTHLPLSSVSSVQFFETHRSIHNNQLFSPSVPYRTTKTLPGRRQASIDITEDIFLTKAEKKKLSKFNFDIKALFSAVENENIDRARMIIETTDVDVSSLNADGFSPLDIAIMTLNMPLIRLLQSYGSKESPNFSTKESREIQLNSLLKEAERCALDPKLCVSNISTNGGLSAALLREKERQFTLCERRLTLLKRMKLGFDKLEPPEPPVSVQLEVVDTCSLKVRFSGPTRADDKKCIVTKYKVEWSCDNFECVDGTLEITDLQKLEVTIENLKSGQNYYVRVTCGNCVGHSIYSYPVPNCAIPSSWRDVDKKVLRTNEKLFKLDDLFQQIIDSRPVNSTEVKVLSIESVNAPYQQRRGQVRKSIKSLFASAPRFQKVMKRGIYLACLLYNEDRILVTNDENLPIVEIDDTYPSSLQNEFYWMLKISCTWEDVKLLRRELEKSQSSSVAHFRSKILQAVEQMQTSLGIQDVGKLYYKPLRDPEGTIVLCTIKNVIDVKSISCLSVRWLPLSKLLKKVTNDENCETVTYSVYIGDLLLHSLQDMIAYHKACNNPLPKGLYLGFVKLKTTVEMMSVVVARNNMNVVPHIRVRENPHVSKEEWSCLKHGLNLNNSLTNINVQCSNYTDSVQLKFLRSISSSAHMLLNSMEISQEEEICGHRIYDLEVIELSSEVSLILLLPPVENVCSIFGVHTDDLPANLDLIYLPLKIYEMIHMNTYQQAFITRYSRISSILEMDILVAQQAHREAFSSNEVQTAKTRLCQIQEFQAILDDLWRDMRWIMNVVTFARDKQTNYCISLQSIDKELLKRNIILEEQELSFQIPTINLYSEPSIESPNSTPPHPLSRRASRDDSSLNNNFYSNQLRCITTSTSSYSLVDSLHFMNTTYNQDKYSNDDMRRCVSASKLIYDSNLKESNFENSVQNLWSNSSYKLCDSCDSDTTNASCDQFEQSISSELKSNLKNSDSASFNSVCFTDLLPNESNKDHSDSRKANHHSNHSDMNYMKNLNHSENSLDAFPFTKSNRMKSKNCVIHVYPDYECGLPFVTSVKLQVNYETTVKEIVETVVRRLNSEVVLKGETSPIYDLNNLSQFCMIAVYDEYNVKHLNNDFNVLNLQTPWTQAKLCIRLIDQ